MVQRLTSSRLLRPGLLLLSLLLAAALLLAQGQEQKPDKPPQDDKEKKEEKKEPASRRIFTGQVALKSSHQESATIGAGIKGVDENGQVAKDVLARQPGAEHYQKVAQLASSQAAAEELTVFLQQANLRQRGGK